MPNAPRYVPFDPKEYLGEQLADEDLEIPDPPPQSPLPTLRDSDQVFAEYALRSLMRWSVRNLPASGKMPAWVERSQCVLNMFLSRRVGIDDRFVDFGRVQIHFGSYYTIDDFVVSYAEQLRQKIQESQGQSATMEDARVANHLRTLDGFVVGPRDWLRNLREKDASTFGGKRRFVYEWMRRQMQSSFSIYQCYR